jgi:succinate dehydrogenase/fumarate reductase iron-sulfur protein
MGGERKTINVECFRFNPEEDSKPRFQKYEVPFVEESCVFDVLEYIYENLDPSLAFYASCRRGVCGRCNIRVNGKASLVCGEKVTGDLKLEPINPKRVIRDLKTDDIKGSKPERD